MIQNILLLLKTFITQNAAETFNIRVYQLMRLQFSWWTETFWTFTANIRLHSFMTAQVYLKVTTVTEFLLTNVTNEPSAVIMW